jgi:D-lactate dehydrogenase
MNYHVYFYEAFKEEEESLKKYLPEKVKAGFTWKTIQEAAHEKAPAAIISTRTQSIFPENWADDLKAILSRSTGFDHLLDYREQSKTNAQLGYLPLYCKRAVAEQALMLWLSLVRRLPDQIQQFDEFARDGLTGYELGAKKLVVYGVGNIGHEVYKIGLALNMEVYGVDIDERHNDVRYISPQKGAEIADVIVSAMNLTDENRGYFDNDFFSQVKPGVIFVNISRGELSPSSILVNNLQSKQIAAVGLDVFDQEKALSEWLRGKIKTNNDQVEAVKQMQKMHNVILTPHNAFNTLEAVERKSSQSIEQLIFFLENNRFRWSV